MAGRGTQASLMETITSAVRRTERDDLVAILTLDEESVDDGSQSKRLVNITISVRPACDGDTKEELDRQIKELAAAYEEMDTLSRLSQLLGRDSPLHQFDSAMPRNGEVIN